MKNSLRLILFIIIAAFGCSTKISQPMIEISAQDKAEEISIKDTTESINHNTEKQKVLLGIDVLESQNFDLIAGKRVGLITNQTGVNSQLKSTIDILNDNPLVNLVALFGPEHGVRGDVEGGNSIKFYKDPKTNLPVYSLYGKNRKPSKEMLKGIDVLVYDIQDIGVRSYTFISTMGMSMEAASENGVDFLILDRPNPLGGEKVEGNITEKEYISFISQFPIPYVYGLTCAELAQLLVKENIIETSPEFNLNIIAMKNWKRFMVWEDTDLQWIPTSPHIPQSISSIFYPMTGILGELRSVISIGVGYTLPFQIIGAEWINSENLLIALNKLNIPGLKCRSFTFQPYYGFGQGEIMHGIQLYITDYSLLNLTKTQFYIMSTLAKLYPDKDLLDLADNNEINMFNKAIGTNKIFLLLKEKAPLNDIFSYLDKDIESFRKTSNKYFLY